jgi:hypothetical protein
MDRSDHDGRPGALGQRRLTGSHMIVGRIPGPASRDHDLRRPLCASAPRRRSDGVLRSHGQLPLRRECRAVGWRRRQPRGRLRQLPSAGNRDRRTRTPTGRRRLRQLPAVLRREQSDTDHDGDETCDLDDGVVRFCSTPTTSRAAGGGFTSWNVYEGDLDVLKGTGPPGPGIEPAGGPLVRDERDLRRRLRQPARGQDSLLPGDGSAKRGRGRPGTRQPRGRKAEFESVSVTFTPS